MDNPRIGKKLSDLNNSESGVIIKVMGHGSFRKRITEMGFIRGQRVTVIKSAPMMDPVEYRIMGYHVALRRSEADLIEVDTSIDSDDTSTAQQTLSTLPVDLHRAECPDIRRRTAGSVINVALVGNPNSGKTSLFNVISGLHEHVGNYSGVTVDAKSATRHHGDYVLNVSDLPGTYSITEYTPEELYVRRHLLDSKPDVVINVIDASNLERNLYLTAQLIDMNLRVVIALNMYDEMETSGAKLDYDTLGRMIGIPIVPTVASRGDGTTALLDRVVALFEDREPQMRHVHINYGTDIEHSINLIQDMIWRNADLVAHYSSRYLAIKLIEGDRSTLEAIGHVENFDSIIAATQRESAQLEKTYHDRIETTIANAKYGFIAGALSETYTPGKGDKNHRATRIDNIVTHRLWGFPIFLAIMWVMFQTTFSLGAIPAEWIAKGVEWIGSLVGSFMADGSLKDLIVDGVISGVGGVVVFLPNILLLFFFISLMEDTGYMARTAFIMDRFMHRIGLHGKSFIPLLMGFGCNVPAIMATRTLESRKDRLLTMLIIPFVSCSARLPVYVLLISAFFPVWQGLVLLSIYMLGIVVAVLSSLMLKSVLFKSLDAPFVMELPPYRIPTARSVVRHMWSKGAQYLRKMGSVILIASVLIWALGHYPRPESTTAATSAGGTVAPIANSYIGRMGHFIEPVIRPLGFDWKIGVSLVSGMAAKEIVVSTMAVLSSSSSAPASAPDSMSIDDISDEAVGDTDEDLSALVRGLRSEVHTTGAWAGTPVYTPLVAYSMMVFILLYFPCVAVVATIRKEAGWRWAVFTVLYTTALAWLLSFATFQIGTLIAAGI